MTFSNEYMMDNILCRLLKTGQVNWSIIWLCLESKANEKNKNSDSETAVWFPPPLSSNLVQYKHHLLNEIIFPIMLLCLSLALSSSLDENFQLPFWSPPPVPPNDPLKLLPGHVFPSASCPEQLLEQLVLQLILFFSAVSVNAFLPKERSLAHVKVKLWTVAWCLFLIIQTKHTIVK